VMGNHEDFMVGNNQEWWPRNGGDITLRSYEDANLLFKEHKEWMKTLPVYLEFDACLVGETKRKLVVSHSCIYNYYSHKDSAAAGEGILWGRDFQDCATPILIYNVFGHTPVKHIEVRDWGAMTDTACVFGGSLTAFNPKTFKVIQVAKDSKD